MLPVAPLILLLACLTWGSSGAPSFQPETVYQYDYTLDFQVVNVARPSIPRSQLQVHATVQTYLLWRNKTQPEEQLVHVQISNFTILNKSREVPDTKETTAQDHEDTEKKSSLSPMLFHWSSGKVLGLYSTKEDIKVLDLKRGLVSLFQFQSRPGIHLEEDASGSCQVMYNVTEDLINKTKDLDSCLISPFGYEADHMVLGVSWNSSCTGYLLLNGTTFKKAVSVESYNLSASLSSLLGSHISTRQQIELMFSHPGPPEMIGDNVEVILGMLPDKYQKVQIRSHPPKPHEDTSLLSKYLTTKKNPTNFATSKISTVQHFRKLVETLRYARKRDVLQLLKKASSNVLPFFIDAALAAQSPASLSALSEFLDFSKKKQVKLHEKFLHSAAFVPHPSTDLLDILLEKLKEKVSDTAVMETGIIIMGAIVGKLCRMDLCEEKVVELAKATLLEGLNNAQDEAEMKIYLLSLKNTGMPETIPILLQYAEKHTGTVCSTALYALQGFPAEFLSTQEVKDTMKNIFYQIYKKYDKKSRLMAAETLLSADCSLVDLNSISAGLELMEMESSKILLSKLYSKQKFQHPLHTKKQSKDNLQHWNYWNLSRTGQSTVYSGLLTATNDMAATYGLDLQFSDSGLAKRSVTSITLFDHNHHLSTMQVSIEAAGLESLIGTEDNEDESADASIGMSAVLFDIQLRPVVFFQGYIDLMSKVFSSTGEPTSLVKGNVLLIDYLQWLPMQSGLQAIVQYQGGLGLEVSATVNIGIWDLEAKTKLTTKAGLVLEFKTEVDTSLFHIDMKSQVDGQSSMDFDTIMRLGGSPMPMCLQLGQEDLPYRETYTLTESFPETNTTRTVRKGRKATLWGRDFPFHHANSEMCRTWQTEEDIVTELSGEL